MRLLGRRLERIDVRRPVDRVGRAVWARRHATNDFFGGWEETDLQLLRRYRPAHVPDPRPGEIVDWLGIRTPHRLHAWMGLSETDVFVARDLPVPDDRVHAETIEYVALLTSIDRARAVGDGQFTAFEMGSSYGPWTIAAGVAASRAGFRGIHLTALEASAAMTPNILVCAGINGLTEMPNVSLRAMNGALTTHDGFAYWPRVDPSRDNGAQVAPEPGEIDYRGLHVDYDRVQTFTLSTLASNTERIDFLHVDIQGVEGELLADASFLEVIDAKVSTFFLATQSRLIEGLALRNLSGLGWRLLRERPTVFAQNDRTRDVNGWTLRDGGQLWVNGKFGQVRVQA
jgi:FkbM family methyltransferase